MLSRKQNAEREVCVDIDTQTLNCLNDGNEVRTFDVSTAVRGTGQQSGSYQTPLGHHIIRAKIGADQPAGAVFVGRRPTGERWTEALHEQHPDRDWILSRILWLSGTERGVNRLGSVDTMRRYIYIHGTPPCETLGQPGSHGCVRMRNEDLLWLFDWVSVGTSVTLRQTHLIVQSVEDCTSQTDA